MLISCLLHCLALVSHSYARVFLFSKLISPKSTTTHNPKVSQ